jgi:hypothetical protein
MLMFGFTQFLQSFANKHISSSEDRLEETKRKKLSIKCQKLVELMMVSGIPTASGYEERIRFSELEVVDAGAIEHGVLSTLPEGHYLNGWDVNVAGVRTTSVKRNIRYHKHAVGLVDHINFHFLDVCSYQFSHRNSSCASREKGSSNISSAVDMGILIGCTRSYERSYQGRFFLRCPGKTSKAQQRRTFSAGLQEAMMMMPPPYLQSQLWGRWAPNQA